MKTTLTITIETAVSHPGFTVREPGYFVTVNHEGDQMIRDTAEALIHGSTNFAENIKRALVIEENLIEMKKKREYMESQRAPINGELEAVATNGIFFPVEPPAPF